MHHVKKEEQRVKKLSCKRTGNWQKRSKNGNGKKVIKRKNANRIHKKSNKFNARRDRKLINEKERKS